MGTVSTLPNSYHTLGSVGHRSRNSSGDLESVRGELVVNVKAKSRHDKVELQARVGGKLLYKGGEHVLLSGKHDRKEDDESNNLCDGEL